MNYKYHTINLISFLYNCTQSVLSLYNIELLKNVY